MPFPMPTGEQTPYIAHSLADRRGVTAIEYAFIAMLIALVCIIAWTLIGTSLSSIFNTVGSSI